MYKQKVLVAGIAGASLGTEIAKALALHPGKYEVYGCDIAPLAFGHFQADFTKTFVLSRQNYVADVLRVLQENDIKILIPGGEEPMRVLSQEVEALNALGVKFAGNTDQVVATCSDKDQCFQALQELGVKIPKTINASAAEDLQGFPFPVVVKPATGSGGSTFVFLAQDADEALIYVTYLRRNGRIAVVQEYIPEDEGEYTVGVLSLPNGEVYGAIAMRRIFHCKLSVMIKTSTGLISSGYSQGLIESAPHIEKTCIEIAKKMGSRGPFNVQGRIRNGEFMPFEINPRFSASTHLRALAGFNEIDVFIQALQNQPIPPKNDIREGYYLRSLTETFAPKP